MVVINYLPNPLKTASPDCFHFVSYLVFFPLLVDYRQLMMVEPAKETRNILGETIDFLLNIFFLSIFSCPNLIT